MNNGNDKEKENMEKRQNFKAGWIAFIIFLIFAFFVIFFQGKA